MHTGPHLTLPGSVPDNGQETAQAKRRTWARIPTSGPHHFHQENRTEARKVNSEKQAQRVCHKDGGIAKRPDREDRRPRDEPLPGAPLPLQILGLGADSGPTSQPPGRGGPERTPKAWLGHCGLSPRAGEGKVPWPLPSSSTPPSHWLAPTEARVREPGTWCRLSPWREEQRAEQRRNQRGGCPRHHIFSCRHKSTYHLTPLRCPGVHHSIHQEDPNVLFTCSLAQTQTSCTGPQWPTASAQRIPAAS